MALLGWIGDLEDDEGDKENSPPRLEMQAPKPVRFTHNKRCLCVYLFVIFSACLFLCVLVSVVLFAFVCASLFLFVRVCSCLFVCLCAVVHLTD